MSCVLTLPNVQIRYAASQIRVMDDVISGASDVGMLLHVCFAGSRDDLALLPYRFGRGCRRASQAVACSTCQTSRS
eukprot:scaffold111372_cov46-Prasinocladus_malaysianus.AAC.1